MGSDYDNLYDAYAANLWDRGFKQTYNGMNAEEYFGQYVGKELSEIEKALEEIEGKAWAEGEPVDDLYQSVIFEWTEKLVLKAVHDYRAKVEVEDVDYKVEYDEINHSYTVDIAGVGTYQVIETEEKELVIVNTDTVTEVEKETTPVPEPEPTPEPEPEPEPEPTPEPEPEPTPEPEPEPTPEPEPEPTPEPEPPPEPEPMPEPEPELIPEPETTPEPTPVPTPEPAPEPIVEPAPVPTPEFTPLPTPELTLVVPTVEEILEPVGAVLGAVREFTETAVAAVNQFVPAVLGESRALQTGDGSGMAAWGAAALAALAALAGWMIAAKKKSRNN